MTHNGDIDGWKPHSEMLPNHKLVLWLEKALQCPSPNRQLDSYAALGVLNLVRAKVQSQS